jgi:hypothetical protein
MKSIRTTSKTWGRQEVSLARLCHTFAKPKPGPAYPIQLRQNGLRASARAETRGGVSPSRRLR